MSLTNDQRSAFEVSLFALSTITDRFRCISELLYRYQGGIPSEQNLWQGDRSMLNMWIIVVGLRSTVGN
jgi:hypothetical protein